MARLRRIGPDGAPQGEGWDLGAELVIGRGDDCGAVLDDSLVSRAHARVELVPGGFDLLDLGSANGTFVADCRVQRYRLQAGEAFRVGATSLVVEAAEAPGALGSYTAPAPPASSWPPPTAAPHVAPWPQQQPRRQARSSGWLWGLGCLSLAGLAVLLVTAGVGLVWWKSVQPTPEPTQIAPGEREPSTTPTAQTRADGEVARTAPGISVPIQEADILRFTLRLSTNPVLDGCAAMPEAWTPPSLELPLSTRVAADGSFRIEQEATDAAGHHRVEAEGRWADEALELRGRWTTRLSGGGDEQSDEGTFEASGRRLAGTWFGDRLTAAVRSRFQGAACREGIDNGYSRVDALEW